MQFVKKSVRRLSARVTDATEEMEIVARTITVVKETIETAVMESHQFQRLQTRELEHQTPAPAVEAEAPQVEEAPQTEE